MDGRFSAELWYRIGGLQIHVPPLRERREDVRALATQELSRLALESGVDPFEIDTEGWAQLATHSWPGNVRELLFTIRKMVADSEGERLLGRLDVDEALRAYRAEFKPSAQFDARERERLQGSLDAAGWNVTATARALGMSRGGLRHRMRALGLE